MPHRYEVRLANTAKRDLRRMGPGPERNRVRAGLERLADEDPSLDIKALAGAPGWLRLRVGDYRVLYFHVPDNHKTIIIGRVPHRSELERAVTGLPQIGS